jgi:hypothetical protein
MVDRYRFILTFGLIGASLAAGAAVGRDVAGTPLLCPKTLYWAAKQ